LKAFLPLNQHWQSIVLYLHEEMPLATDDYNNVMLKILQAIMTTIKGIFEVINYSTSTG